MDARKAEEPTHYFRMIKELSLLGFFTSEIGYTKAMRYIETPGRFDPCVPLAPATRCGRATHDASGSRAGRVVPACRLGVPREVG